MGPLTGARASSPPVQARPQARKVLAPAWPRCFQNRPWKASRPRWVSWSPRASTSPIRYGWARIAPWPNTIRQRVRILAPSTVMAMGTARYRLPR
ncbi:Uncharacterised protein [Bordetella pertussis]|nr:Uncharacterised protein [Bordetella pertussis]